MNKDEALRLALEALEMSDICADDCKCTRKRAITAIKAALEAKDEPVAWMSEEDDCIFFDKDKPNPMDYYFWTPLYTTPPQRTWVGLTEIEVDECYESVMFNPDIEPTRVLVYQAIEAKLKEKNT